MNALLTQRRRRSLRIVEAALAATPASILGTASPASSTASNPPKETPTMPIRNAPKKPKASSKTDAMKALTTDLADAPETDEAVPAPAAPPAPRPFVGVLRSVAPKPTAPTAPAFVSARAPDVVDTAGDDALDPEDGEDDEPAPTDAKKPLVAFDAQVWQWVSDSGAFVHIKTGEARQEDEFLKPGGRSRNEEDSAPADWDAPQDSANDW